MRRPIIVFALFAASTALIAQQGNTSAPYSGVSNPPPDDTIITDAVPAPQSEPIAKPPAGHPMQDLQSVPLPAQPMQQQTMTAPAVQAANPYVTGSDNGIVQVAPPAMQNGQPTLQTRDGAFDPDGDIVHPEPLPQGVMVAGTQIRVRLMDELSSGLTQKGQPFRSRVSSDVEQNGQILIPAGAEIDGFVAEVSRGRFGGQGSLLLRPDRVVLPDGSSYQLHAFVRQTPMSKTHVDREGTIVANDNLKRDSIIYGGAVGTGVVAGAYLGGPVGALAGGLVGAGVATVHLLVTHPQARVNEGDVLVLTLSDNMKLDTMTRTGE